MSSIHDLDLKKTEGSVIHHVIPLSSEKVNEHEIYLLENDEDCLIYIGSTADPDTMRKLFGISSQYDNPLSKKLNEVINEIRSQRCNYLCLKLCRKGDPSGNITIKSCLFYFVLFFPLFGLCFTTGALFFSYIVEDKSPGGLSYIEFLVHVLQQIQSKMT
ncbi:putative ADF-H/Gelsolin-like domain superfamily [Helianthus anomalus]